MCKSVKMNFIEDVVSCFQDLKSYERIMMMCRLQHCCLPFELRFLGTCLEDLGKRDFYEFKKSEVEANDITELYKQDLSTIRNKEVQKKLIIYLSLLHTYNYNCSSKLYKILTNIEEVYAVLRAKNVDSSDSLERIFMIYTLAINHPAFTSGQKKLLRTIFATIQLEESKYVSRNKGPATFIRNSQIYNDVNPVMCKVPLEAANEQYQSPEPQSLENTSQCFTVIPPYAGEMSVPLQNQYQPNFIRYAFPVNSSSQLITTTWPTGVPMTFAPSDASIMTSNVAPSSSVPSKSETSSRCTSPNISVVRPFSAPQNKTSLYNDQSLIRDDSNAVADFSSYSAEQTSSLAAEEFTDVRYGEESCTINKRSNSNITGRSSLVDNKTSEYSAVPMGYVRKFPNGTIPVAGIYFTPQLPSTMDNATATPVSVLCTATNPCQYCINQQSNELNGLNNATADMRLLRLDSDIQNCNSISSNSDSGSLDNSPCSTPTIALHSENLDKEMHANKWTDRDECSGSRSAPEESTSYDEKCMPPPAPPSSTSSLRRRGRSYSRSYVGSGGHHNYSSNGRPGNSDSRKPADISLINNNSGSDEPIRRSYSSSSDSVLSFPSTNSASSLPISNGGIYSADCATTAYVQPQYYQRSYPSFTSANYMRPPYPFATTSSNADILYRNYPHHSLVVTTPVGTSMIPMQNATVCPDNIPRKTFCCNCGAQNHVMEDCPEPTMEDTQNMYHIDFSQPIENVFTEGGGNKHMNP